MGLLNWKLNVTLVRAIARTSIELGVFLLLVFFIHAST